MPKSSKPKRQSKPRRDFPLFPHATGRWAKKIRQRFHYFGKVADDPGGQKALAKWLDQKDDLLAGRTPRAAGEGLTIKVLLNTFLTAKQTLVSSGELSARTWADYFDTCKRIGKVFGLRQLVADLNAPDLERLPAELARIGGAVTLGNEVTRARVVFGYAYQQGLIEHPVKFGAGFKRPTKKTLRLARAAKGPRMFDAEPLRKLLDAAPMPLRAMILLGINCGFGNADCAGLPVKALDLDGAWVNYPRPKTGISRRCPLWPETVAALLEAITNRPAPRDEAHAGLAFLTCRGNPWGSAVLEEPEEPGGKPKVHIDDPLAKEFAKLVRSHKGWRPGLSFYALRHTFETIGGDSRDQVAVDHIMGHGRNDMSSVYRERISDERLKAVTDHVRRWLFGRDVGAEAVDLNKLVAAEQAAESTLPDTPPARRPTKARRSRTKAK